MSRTVRVGFDGRALASPAGGVRRYAWELFGALAASGSTFNVVAIGPPAELSLPEGISRVAPGPSLPLNIGWMLTGLPRAARRGKLDVFHAPSYTAPLGGPRPMVLTIHDVSYERHPEWYPYKRDPIRRAFYRHSARAADRIITDSHFSKSEIVAAYGLRPESIDVVPLAAASVFRPGPKAASPSEWPTTYVLHVGDLHQRRNLPMVARAVAAARTRGAACRHLGLVLAGVDRGSADELQRIARSESGPPLITFTGSINEATLLGLYRGASAFVYPSRYEGFGLPPLEAMSCGVPVIAANSSSLPEVVGDGGVLLDPDDEAAWVDTIECIVSDAGHAARLGAAALARAARFSWQRTAVETSHVYLRVLGEMS